MGFRTSLHPLGGAPLKDPYPKGTILFKEGGGEKTQYVYEAILEKGVFCTEVVSSAGTCAAGIAGVWYFGSGGSGAVWRGFFHNPKKQKIKIVVNLGNAAETYLELGGVKMLTLTGGQGGSTGGGGIGGTLKVNPNFKLLKTEIALKGTNGRTGNSAGGGNSYTISPSTFRPWGDCTNNGWAGKTENGGIYLQFKCLSPSGILV